MSSPASPRVAEARPARHPSGRGISLELYHADVRRLVAAQRRYIEASGLEVEDVVSEVYRRILVANETGAAYDPERGVFSMYIRELTRSVLWHMRGAVLRRQAHEVSCSDTTEAWQEPDQAAELEGAILDQATGPAHARALHLMAAGATDAEVLEACGDAPIIRHELEARRARGRRGRRAP